MGAAFHLPLGPGSVAAIDVAFSSAASRRVGTAASGVALLGAASRRVGTAYPAGGVGGPLLPGGGKEGGPPFAFSPPMTGLVRALEVVV